MASSHKYPLIAIVGPTASGKTALAIKLAQRFRGEIICADSRTVYKGMDIGTAKPTTAERSLVPHHLLDILEPNEPFSVAEFQRLAREAITDIQNRDGVPFLVGGSGLYIDSVIFDYEFGRPSDEGQRRELSAMTINELQQYCIYNNIVLPENDKNKRYLIRTIEQKGIVLRKRDRIIEDCLAVGISTDREVLKRRISQRTDQLFAAGMLDEAIEIGIRYGWNHESMTGNVYRLAGVMKRGEISVNEAKAKINVLDWRLAKRQLTWFKRNPFIQWGSVKEVEAIVRAYLK